MMHGQTKIISDCRFHVI